MESSSNNDVKSQGNETKAKPQELMFTTRAKQGITTYQIESRSPLSFKQVEKLSDATATMFEYSVDGSLLWVSNSQQFQILDTANQTVLKQVPYPNIGAVSFSPSGKFFVTWEKPTPEKPNENLIIWNTSTAEPVVKLNQKQVSADNWPVIRWSDDDSVAYRLFKDEVVFYNAPSFSENKLRIEHLSGVQLSPGPLATLKVAIFVPEKKNMPGSAKIYKYGEFREPVASKNFFKAQQAQLLWNSTGTVLLVVSHTDVDKSGKNYYGETGLYYMQADGKLTTNVVLKKEGPIHDCKWAPSGKEFLVIYGLMPAEATLFNLKCEPLIDFGAAKRNTIRWNSSSRLVLIGGFGNLSGQMDIWDRKKVKKIGTGTADYTSSIEWSPDNRYLLTGVLFHRMRIGNEFSIRTGDGKLISKQAVDELYQVQWKPMTEAAVKELMLATPKPPKSDGKTEVETAAAAPAPAKTGVYRPPHFSGSSIKKEETGPIKYNRASPVTAPKAQPKELPPGYDAEDSPRKPGQNKKKKGQQQQAPAPQPIAVFEEPGGGVDVQKKIKTLTRQLANIDKLKNDKENGKTLNAEQEKLLASEDSLRDEMEKLSVL